MTSVFVISKADDAVDGFEEAKTGVKDFFDNVAKADAPEPIPDADHDQKTEGRIKTIVGKGEPETEVKSAADKFAKADTAS